jgi:hypothetical protein
MGLSVARQHLLSTYPFLQPIKQGLAKASYRGEGCSNLSLRVISLNGLNLQIQRLKRGC